MFFFFKVNISHFQAKPLSDHIEGRCLESSSVLLVPSESTESCCAANCFSNEKLLTDHTSTSITEVVSRLNSGLHSFDAAHNEFNHNHMLHTRAGLCCG